MLSPRLSEQNIMISIKSSQAKQANTVASPFKNSKIQESIQKGYNNNINNHSSKKTKVEKQANAAVEKKKKRFFSFECSPAAEQQRRQLVIKETQKPEPHQFFHIRNLTTTHQRAEGKLRQATAD